MHDLGLLSLEPMVLKSKCRKSYFFEDRFLFFKILYFS